MRTARLLSRIAPCVVSVAAALSGDAAAAPPGRPDLIVDAAALAASVTVQPAHIEDWHCGLEIGCLNGIGFRRLLVFDVLLANIAEDELLLGNPATSPLYTSVSCQPAEILESFLVFELIGPGSAVAASVVRKPECIEDGAPYLSDPWVPPSPSHNCINQGLQGGWSYRMDLSQSCQWIDVTDVPPGDYSLRVTLNPDRVVAESRYSNNVVSVPVTLPAALPDPDLVFDLTTLGDVPDVVSRYFAPAAHEVAEGCVSAPGYRDLLRFSVQTANISRTDFVLGDPNTDPRWEFSPSHGHHHFRDFSDYRLLDLQGNLVAPGNKLGWFIADTDLYLSEPWVPATPYYTHTFGIARGWSDVYFRGIPCQWIDVTGLPNGFYRLRTTVNPVGILPESDYTNNSAEIVLSKISPAGVVHRPDGHFVPGEPLVVEPEGAGLRISYDVALCPADRYNVLYGVNRPVSDYVFDGAVCDVGGTGSALIALPDPQVGKLLWFTLAGSAAPVNGQVIEGGHGHRSDGTPRPLTGRPFCGITRSESVSRCGAPIPEE